LKNEKVLKIHPAKKFVTLKNDETHFYDKLLLATGSLPNTLENGKESISYPTLGDYQNLKLSPGSFIIRNINEINSLHQRISNFKDSNVNQNKIQSKYQIVIIGSGALSVDIVSSLLDGYKSESSIIIISRRKYIGFPLLDVESSKIITSRVLKKYPNVKIIFEDSIESIDEQKETKKIILKSKIEIECNILIQAVGVHPNT
jgi:NADPH-dependent 2,4-dienoyl-CoA reductase/sulfur reductase-like enzyme